MADEPVSMIDASLRATVLNSLQQLREEFGISIVYITHDLTTAYQISDNIIVLYRGSVTEAGSVDQIVQNPSHPYTRLLVGSIPNPDPDQSWAAEADPAIANGNIEQQSCKFVSRCPSAVQKCLEQVPPLYQSDEHRAVACFLYEQSPVLASENMDSVFVPYQPVSD